MKSLMHWSALILMLMAVPRADAALPAALEAEVTRLLETERPLERTGPDTFRTEDHPSLVFVFKPGQSRAKYLHVDLLSAIHSGG